MMMTERVAEEVPKPDHSSLLSKDETPKVEQVVPVTTIPPRTKSSALPSFPHYSSPLTTRSRKITSPSSSFPYSPVSSVLSLSSSDLSDVASPGSTPVLARQRTVSSCQDEADKGSVSTMSRSSSTLSLCSNVSQVSSALTPVEKLLKHLREKLVGYLFSGWYTERRYIDPIDRYRDVILVDAVDALVVKQIKYAIRKCRKIFEKNSFLGISFVEEECKMFVNLHCRLGGGGLEVTHPFGHYWLQVRSVNFITNLGLIFELGVVRQFVGSDSEACWRCKARETTAEETPVKIDSITGAVVDLKSRMVQVSSDVMADLWRPHQAWAQLRPHLTARNVVQLGKLLMVLVLATFTGIVAGVKQLSNFSLKLLHELANLVDRSTPFALGALGMMSKVVGGAYLLLAMVWRDAVKKPSAVAGPPQSGRPQLTVVGAPAVSRRRVGTEDRQDPRAAMDNMYSQDRNW